MNRRFSAVILEFLRLLPPVRLLTGRRPLLQGAVQRWLFFRLARRYTPLIASQDADGLEFLVPTSDAVASLRFVHRGSEDREVLDRTFHLLARIGHASSNETRVLLDIGANIGTTTVAALRFGHATHVIAIEAHPETTRLLQQNVILNDVADQVTVITAAVTDHVGYADLALSTVNSGDHRIRIIKGKRSGFLARKTISVPATTIETLLEHEEIPLSDVALVWLDVQGHEWHALHAAHNLLESNVPVVLEYWPEGLIEAGTLGLLEELARQYFSSFVDLRASPLTAARRPVDELPALRTAYRGSAETDVLLLRD